MEYSKIENHKVYYRITKEAEWIKITEIGKDDILKLLTAFKDDEDFKLVEYENDKIKNEAHNIIYKSIYSKFQELILKREQIIDDSNNRYMDAINKYKDINDE